MKLKSLLILLKQNLFAISIWIELKRHIIMKPFQ